MEIQILAVPYDTALRAYRMGAGPEHLLNAGLVEHLELAGHHAWVGWIEAQSDPPAEIRTAFELNRELSRRIHAALAEGRFPLVLAGNCISSIGTLAGVSEHPTGVLWFDSHGDFNTPDTTLGGFLDGMALAAATGRCWNQMAATVPGFHPVAEQNALLLGTRDLDPLEAEALAASGVRLIPPAGLATALEPALADLKTRVSGAYLHLDLDVLDPAEGRVNVFAAPDGPTLDQMKEALRTIARQIPLRAAALTAYDPSYDEDGRVVRAAFELLDALINDL